MYQVAVNVINSIQLKLFTLSFFAFSLSSSSCALYSKLHLQQDFDQSRLSNFFAMQQKAFQMIDLEMKDFSCNMMSTE
jgi:hypothetical protein